MVLVGTCRWEFETGPMYIPTFQDKVVLELRVSPAFASTYFCSHCNIWFENTSKYVDTLILFSKNLNQRSLTPTWPLTPCLLRSHVWLYPRIIVSKSHDNTSMYVDTVINLANYHIHTHTTYIHTTYYVQNEWSHSLLLSSVQARQKSDPFIYQPTRFWSKFWQSYPPFFLFIVFCFSNFLRFKPILAQTSEKIEKSTHSYTRFLDMGSLIYWYTRSYPGWWHILVGSFVLSTIVPPPPRSNIS